MENIQVGFWVVVLLVVLAVGFDFMNGFHDAANSIATVVSTGVLKPQQAVAFAAAFNVIAYFVFHLKVAATVGKGTIDPAIVDHYVIFGALVGAIGWNIVTWIYGIPSSSSHALIGGLVGAALAKSGWSALNIGYRTTLAEYGIDGRHLRAFKLSAEREVGLVEQAIAPYVRRAAGNRDVPGDVTQLVISFHAALVRTAMERTI